MPPVTVRQAVFADIDLLAPLFDQYRQFQRQAGDLARARAFLRARFDHGDAVVFMAFHGERAIGFANLYPSYSSVALKRVFVLNDLYVDASVRRTKAASALLAAVERHAWAHDAARLTLSVARDNLVAQAVYDARGWVRDDVFLMLHRHAPSAPPGLTRPAEGSDA